MKHDPVFIPLARCADRLKALKPLFFAAHRRQRGDADKFFNNARQVLALALSKARRGEEIESLLSLHENLDILCEEIANYYPRRYHAALWAELKEAGKACGEAWEIVYIRRRGLTPSTALVIGGSSRYLAILEFLEHWRLAELEKVEGGAL